MNILKFSDGHEEEIIAHKIYYHPITCIDDDFDDNRFYECAPGIHFFINRKEAENYIY